MLNFFTFFFITLLIRFWFSTKIKPFYARTTWVNSKDLYETQQAVSTLVLGISFFSLRFYVRYTRQQLSRWLFSYQFFGFAPVAVIYTTRGVSYYIHHQDRRKLCDQNISNSEMPWVCCQRSLSKMLFFF